MIWNHLVPNRIRQVKTDEGKADSRHGNWIRTKLEKDSNMFKTDEGKADTRRNKTGIKTKLEQDRMQGNLQSVTKVPIIAPTPTHQESKLNPSAKKNLFLANLGRPWADFKVTLSQLVKIHGLD